LVVNLHDNKCKVYVGRPESAPKGKKVSGGHVKWGWGNPFSMGGGASRGSVIRLYTEWLMAPERAEMRAEVVPRSPRRVSHRCGSHNMCMHMSIFLRRGAICEARRWVASACRSAATAMCSRGSPTLTTTRSCSASWSERSEPAA